MGKKSLLPPGFRFHPTDVELVKYYLKRKLLGKKLHFQAIAEVEIYKYAPWDLPGKSCLRTGDLKWYFFCPTEKKYASGVRMKRATDIGYWKPTGKDRSIQYKNKVVGMIKTLVFHTGRAPKGDRTDWVMYEYRLEEKELADKGIAQDEFVLCVIFKKDGPGPKNGAQYGAPFNEDEWDDGDDEVEEEVNAQPAILPALMHAPAFMLPNNPNMSIATSSCVPESTCTGPLISCPSQAPSTACSTLPRVSNDDVASTEALQVVHGGVNGGEADSDMPAFQQPCKPNSSILASSSSYVLENTCSAYIRTDDFLSMLDFLDNDNTKIADFGGIAEPETGIFENLGDLPPLEGGGDSIPISQYFMDPLLPGSNADYLELMDLDSPLTDGSRLPAQS
uniref:NAC domain-containing protein n=1 Tax=Populus davidiana TaxID=266767 RepID=A0A6M2EVH4_9ROSI